MLHIGESLPFAWTASHPSTVARMAVSSLYVMSLANSAAEVKIGIVSTVLSTFQTFISGLELEAPQEQESYGAGIIADALVLPGDITTISGSMGIIG
jgi:hypothetical protein